MTPYYEHAGITIFHGDCREVLPSLEPVDLVLTDPPYGVGKASWDAYLPTDWMKIACHLTKRMGVMPGTSNLFGLPDHIGPLSYRWTLAVHLVNGMTRGKMGFGNWFPIVCYGADDISLYRPQSDACDIAVGTEPMPDHPSPKPFRAMRWAIERFEGASVLDPFMGSGTTLRAAKDLGRSAIGIEINERYCEIAAKRLSQEVIDFEAIA